MKKHLFSLLLFSICTYADGQITFQKSFGWLPNSWENGISVQQTTDGGYILAGAAEDTAGGYSYSPYSKVYLIKVDSNGNTTWKKSYGKIGFDEEASEVIQTTDGGYIIAVGTENTNVYLIKTNANGDTLWTKAYRVEPPAYSYASSIQQTIDGGYIVGGYYSPTGSSDEDDCYLMKIDASGGMVWTKAYGGITLDRIAAVKQTFDRGYIAVGRTQSFGAGQEDAYLIKTDSAGIILWTKSYGGGYDDNGISVQQVPDSGYIIVGVVDRTYANGEVSMIKTNSMGDTLWTKAYGGASFDEGFSVEQTNDNGYIIAGQTSNFNFGSDAYLIKTNATGDTLWTRSYAGISYGVFYSTHQTTDGGYIAMGATDGSGREVYLVKTDSYGNTACNAPKHPTIVSTHAIIVTTPATVITYPAFAVESMDLVISSGGYETTPCIGAGIDEIVKENEAGIYPNPSLGNFVLKFPYAISVGKIECYDMLGKMVYSEKISNDFKKEISLKHVSPGIYFVKVFDGGKSYCEKLIIKQD